MTDRANGRQSESDREVDQSAVVPAEGTETVEAYETDEGVVLYDAENPLAWVQSTTAVAITDAD